MKRSPLQRTTPLSRSGSAIERRTPLERGKPLASQGNGSQRSTAPQRRPISPASRPQRNKVQAEGKCRVCGIPDTVTTIDPAHATDRSIGGCDSPDCVVPLCRICHDRYDAHDLDLLPFLTKTEQAHSVLHLGIEAARQRITNERAL